MPQSLFSHHLRKIRRKLGDMGIGWGKFWELQKESANVNPVFLYPFRNRIIDDDKNNKNKKGKKITDYFAPRRTSNRKTQETIREEKQQLLIKLILDETEDGLQVGFDFNVNL